MSTWLQPGPEFFQLGCRFLWGCIYGNSQVNNLLGCMDNCKIDVISLLKAWKPKQPCNYYVGILSSFGSGIIQWEMGHEAHLVICLVSKYSVRLTILWICWQNVQSVVRVPFCAVLRISMHTGIFMTDKEEPSRVAFSLLSLFILLCCCMTVLCNRDLWHSCSIAASCQVTIPLFNIWIEVL